ncbi:hypothetical protein SAMN02745165_01353 [Malonomonas rubra DSM 5091]|uniref:Uncharacterized protein n=1 Tax=Malonomonas rubra DSM 5091 TaxID=1122189 RepID=A0A1M6FNL7_MALRU|nr:hypothetical protein [Malonomonas rubra]SHI99243.1 hypothetical protein SAMN02745165_01353 [Malonomonas rubra DSM 5091]
MIDNFFNLSHFDRSLTPGMAVLANWHQDGFRYTAEAKIIKLRRASVEVKLVSVGGVNGDYLVGKTLELPRFSDQTRWSSRNCIQPADEKSSQLLARSL